MQKIQQLYRKNYLGEEVVTNLKHVDGEWKETTEFIPNQIQNLQVSNRALIIGNGESRLGIDMNLIAKHRAGPRGLNRLQTYGCNAIYQDYRPDFLVVTGKEIVKEVSRTDYVNENVVYASSWAVAEYPRKFYLIPQNPNWNAGALATYLACFDGHKKIFLLGFDGNDTPNYNYNVYAGRSGYPPRNQTVTEDYWVQSMNIVFETYSDVDFIRVAPTKNFRMPELWKYRTNVRAIDFRDFVLEADL